MSTLTLWLYRAVIVCGGLLAGLVLTHVLQSVGSRSLNGEQWLAVQHTFYGGFAVVGGVLEIVGVLCAVVLAVVVRESVAVRAAAVVAAIGFTVTLVAYFAGNSPVNAAVAQWTSANLPPDWAAYRDAWEAAHLVSAVAATVSFVVLVVVAQPAVSVVRSSRAPIVARND